VLASNNGCSAAMFNIMELFGQIAAERECGTRRNLRDTERDLTLGVWCPLCDWGFNYYCIMANKYGGCDCRLEEDKEQIDEISEGRHLQATNPPPGDPMTDPGDPMTEPGWVSCNMPMGQFVSEIQALMDDAEDTNTKHCLDYLWCLKKTV
jgi:hypothetical protein